MSSCCNDPTEPAKLDPRELQSLQKQYGDLLRDLFTGDPEKVLSRQLYGTSHYLRELAALNGHYQSLRLQAIALLEKDSITVLQQVIDKYPDSKESEAAEQRIQALQHPDGLLTSLMNHFRN